MDILLNIDDTTYQEAARQITNALVAYYPDVNQSDVESVLRRYVVRGAGTTTQPDYGYDNSTGKDLTSRQIAGELTVDPSLVANVLNTLTLYAESGSIDERVAYPRKWETEQENAKAASDAGYAAQHANDPGILEKGVYDFAGAISSGVLRSVEGAFPLVILGFGVWYFLLRGPRTGSARR